MRHEKRIQNFYSNNLKDKENSEHLLVNWILLLKFLLQRNIGKFIQKFSDWPPGTRTANGTVLCH
jgi:hypothetical protein